MKVNINHNFKYEVEHLIKTFDKNIIFTEAESEDVLVNDIQVKDGMATIQVAYMDIHFQESIEVPEDSHIQNRLLKRLNGKLLYDALRIMTGKENKWGTLVGVRPVKIVHALFHEGLTEKEIDERLYNDFRINRDKRKLIIDIAKKESLFLKDSDDVDQISLYICIPFCPTRCLYCSFPSNDLRQKGHLVDAYLTCLHKEIDAAYGSILKYNKTVDCIYIGGGTPSILSAEQFETLLYKLNRYFDLETLKEFTIEAGRPDTITNEKLDVFKKYSVSRLCINPQSMHEKTLKLIGRSHTPKDIIHAFERVKSYNFKSINMDLILGLPDEDLEDVKATLKIVADLEPENITIHTLAVKTSSRLKEKLEEYNMSQADMVEEMLSIAEKTMASHDYYPYYLYRQKNMVGNFENVGYAKMGYESLYNMRIIEEKHNILALGAGAVSKKCYPKDDYFDRIANIKGLEEYMERIDDVIKKTHSFFER